MPAAGEHERMEEQGFPGHDGGGGRNGASGLTDSAANHFAIVGPPASMLGRSMVQQPFGILLLSSLIASASPDERIAEIRRWYGEIQEGRALSEKKTEFESGDETLSGTRVVRKFADGLSSMTVEWGAGDHGASEEHYYFRNGVLFFVFRIEHSWSFVAGGSPEKPVTEDTRKELRYYFDGAECVRALTRSAVSRDAADLEEKIARVEQTELKITPDLAEPPRRAKALLAAESDAELCEILERAD